MSGSLWDRMTPRAQAEMRDDRLHRQYRYQLYAFAPFYRQTLDGLKISPDEIRKVADLPKAPFVTRSMLAKAPSAFFLRPTRQLIQKYGAAGQLVSVSIEMILHGSQRSEQLVRAEYEPIHQLATAGTQGDPITLSLSKRDLASLAVQGQRMLEIAGVGRTDKIVNLLPNQPSGGFWTTWLGGVSLGVQQSAPDSTEPGRVADQAAAEQATVLIGEAAYLLKILRAAGASLRDLRTVILAPHVTPASLRENLEAVAGPQVKVLATYGFAEGRSVWTECAEGSRGSGFHTYPDLEIFEVLRPGTETPGFLGEGGEIVFTGLMQRGTALARYRPGDIVSAIATGPCPSCGRNVDRIMGPVTRVGDLVTVQEPGLPPVEIDKGVLESALEHPDLAGWQLEVTKIPGQSNGYDDLCLLYSPKGEKDPAVLAVELDAILRQKLGVSPQMVLSDRTGGGLVDLR